jgi:Domain of unknown function (DUF1788)
VPWSEVDFDRLRAEVRASLDGSQTPGGLPFFVLVYDPREEDRCLRTFERWASALAADEVSASVVYLGRLLADVLQRDTIYLTDAGAQAERDSREDVRRELARAELLPRLLTTALLEGREGICPPLRDGTQSECVFLLRSGALYPFVHVSQLLSGLENRTQRTVVVAFPGSLSRDRSDSLRFLDETDAAYYRARVIGGQQR